eukprot:1145413-Pelagomonas_calceolata.AAC.6
MGASSEVKNVLQQKSLLQALSPQDTHLGFSPYTKGKNGSRDADSYLTPPVGIQRASSWRLGWRGTLHGQSNRRS